MSNLLENCIIPGANNGSRYISMPVKKGDTVAIWYYGATVTTFKFIYALGQEPTE